MPLQIFSIKGLVTLGTSMWILSLVGPVMHIQFFSNKGLITLGTSKLLLYLVGPFMPLFIFCNNIVMLGTGKWLISLVGLFMPLQIVFFYYFCIYLLFPNTIACIQDSKKEENYLPVTNVTK